MNKLPALKTLAAAATLSFALAGGVVHAQGSTGVATGIVGTESKSTMAKGDQGMMREVAFANLSEIAAGRMAVEKSENPQVRDFAQKMVDSHGKALDELKLIAQARELELPAEPDTKHKAMAALMKPLSGAAFDRMYLSRAGVADHKKTHELLTRVQARAIDNDLKAYAGKMIPDVQAHLSMAEQLQGARKVSRRESTAQRAEPTTQR